MEMYLFSSSGPGASAAWVVQACKDILNGKPDARMVCLPQGVLTSDRWTREVRQEFRGVVEIDVLDTETMDLSNMEAVLRRASLAYIPDGNAYLLNHRLQTSRIAAHLRKKILNGLPVIACGAGAVICGLNVLTSGDLNVVPTSHFDGLGLIPFNIHVHYEDDARRDAWLGEYHVFHDNPVLMLEDGASLRLTRKTSSLRTGPGWVWRARQDKVALQPGEPIAFT